MDQQPDQYTDEQIEFMVHRGNSIRKPLLDRKPHIKKYYKIRGLFSDILDSMATYYEKGKFEQTVNRKILAQNGPYGKKGFEKKNLDFDMTTSQGQHAFEEVNVFKFAPHLSCITEDFIKKKQFKNPEQQEFLQSMLHSVTGLFEVVDTQPFVGYATLRNVLTGKEQQIVDIGLSGTGAQPDIYLFTRIITYRGISISSGLALFFMKDDPYMMEYVQRMKKEPEQTDGAMFVDLYTRYSQVEGSVKVIRNLI